MENARSWGDDGDWAAAVEAELRIAASSEGWGTIGGRARSLVLANLRPRLRYQDVLRSLRASLVSTDVQLTRARPSRRYGFEQLGRRRALKARLLVAIDVSGSMSDAELQVGFSIVHRFFAHRIPEIHVLCFDTEIRGPVRVLRKARADHRVEGRGGTCFEPVMRYVEAHPGYDGVLIYTDGQAEPPPPPRGSRARIVWLFSRASTWRVMAARLGLPGSGLGRACYVLPD